MLSKSTIVNLSYPIYFQDTFDTRSLVASPIWEVNTTQNAPVPVLATYAALARGLQYRVGTNANMTFQTFASSVEPRAGDLVSANASAFIPWLSCQNAEVDLSEPALPVNSTTQNEPFYSITLAVDPCEVYQSANTTSGRTRSASRVAYPYRLPIIDPRSRPVPEKRVSGNIVQLKCENGQAAGSGNPILWFLYDVAYSQEDTNAKASTSNWSVVVRNISAQVCMPYYGVKNVTVTYSSSGSGKTGVYAVTDTFSNPGTRLPAINDSSLFKTFYENLSADTPMLYDQQTSLSNPETSVDPWNAFQFISNVTGKSSVQELLGDSEALRLGIQDVYAGILTQWAKDNIMMTAKIAATANLQRTDKRLHVRESSVLTMIICLGLVILLIASLAVVRPKATWVMKGGSIQSLARALATSEALNEALSTATFPEVNVIKRLLEPPGPDRENLSQKNVQAIFQPSMLLPEKIKKDAFNNVASIPSSTVEWNRPLLGRREVVASVIATPIILLVALEVIQYLSDKDEGFITCGPEVASGLSADSWTHYLPTVILLLVAALYDSLESCILTLSPLLRLKARNVKGLLKADAELYGQLPPVALWYSLRRKHFGAALAIVAAFTGSLLTIVSAGLYVAIPVPESQSVISFATDRFDLAWNATNGDNGAATATSLVSQLNLTYPPWTYGELAFSQIQVEGPGAAGSYLKTRLPAHRASLNCTVLGSDQYNVTLSPEDEGIPPQTSITTIVDLPEHCRSNVTDTTMVIGNVFNMIGISDDRPSGVYAGQLQNIYRANQSDDLHSLQNSNNGIVLPDGCPSVNLVFGYFALNDTMFALRKSGEFSTFDLAGATKANVTNLICTQTMQQVEADVVLEMPGLTFNGSQPPAADERTAQYLTNGTAGVTAFSYHIESNLLTSLTTFDKAPARGPASFLSNFETEPSASDPFFEAILSGADAMPGADLAGPDNVHRLINASNAFYAKYMAQAIDANMRRPLMRGANGTVDASSADKSTTPHAFNGTLVSPSHFRLQQNSAAKLALQAMLAAMAVCGALAYVLSRGMSAVLPQTDAPCSLGATMGLLAGTRLCQEVALHGKCGGQVSLEEVLKEREFRLGWWHVQTGAFEAEMGGLKEEERGEYRYRIDVLRRGEEGGWI